MQRDVQQILTPYLSGKRPLILAVSGGPDSMTLLALCMKIMPPEKIMVAHFDHMIRSESGDDAMFVARYCNQKGVACIIAQENVPLLARRQKLSLEEAGRVARYAFLRQVQIQYHGTVILTAHHRDDHAETILLHLLRGSGLQGLIGLQTRNRDIVRPLLSFSKDELLAYCAKNKIPYRLDKTNLRPTTARNLLRLKIIPLLKQINPGLTETLIRNGEQMQDIQLYLSEKAQDIMKSTQDTLKQSVFSRLPPALQREVLRQWYQDAHGSTDQLSFATVERARLFALRGNSGKKIPFGRDVQLIREHALIRLARKTPLPVSPKKVPLVVPGTTRFGRYTITAKILSALPKKRGLYVAWPKPNKSCWVRTWKSGDRFRPLGMRGQKKLQDFFTDEKIPQALRNTLPLIVDKQDRIVSVYNRRIDDRVKVTPKVSRILSLTFRHA